MICALLLSMGGENRLMAETGTSAGGGKIAVAPANVAPDTALAQAVRRVLPRSHPPLDVDAMLDYYKRTSPDILAEVAAQLPPGTKEPPPLLVRLADHFRKMERLRRRNPKEYARLVELEKLENRARMAGHRIKRLAALVAKSESADTATAKNALVAAKEELRTILEQAFDASQQNERIEINRLDAELRALRRLVDEREAKRDLILQQRFLRLSGQKMPASPVPLATDEKRAAPTQCH